MDALSAHSILKALDGLSARAIVVTENIANAGTPGYRPLRLSFEAALADAARRGPGAVDAVRPTLQRAAAGEPDGRLRLDLELASANTTALRYAALVDLLNRQMQMQASAISGGN